MSNSRHSERSEESLFARELVTHSADETIALGRELAAHLRPPVLVCLDGELGAGKTTLAKGIISGLGAAREEDVTSPTFTLVHVFRKDSAVIPSAARSPSDSASSGTAEERSLASLGMTEKVAPRADVEAAFRPASPAQTPADLKVGATQASLNVFHVDLYRVSDRHDFETLGLEDVFAAPAIVLVEWPDRLALRTDWPIVQIKLEHADGDTRRIKITEATK